jgi:hypothetical protein
METFGTDFADHSPVRKLLHLAITFAALKQTPLRVYLEVIASSAISPNFSVTDEPGFTTPPIFENSRNILPSLSSLSS